MTDAQTQDTMQQIAGTQSRRCLLRRSMLGVAAVGLTGLLAACGDDEEDNQVVTGQGAEDPGENPGIKKETGIGQGSDETTGDATAEDGN